MCRFFSFEYFLKVYSVLRSDGKADHKFNEEIGFGKKFTFGRRLTTEEEVWLKSTAVQSFMIAFEYFLYIRYLKN